VANRARNAHHELLPLIALVAHTSERNADDRRTVTRMQAGDDHVAAVI
jgi:hypothetical protein